MLSSQANRFTMASTPIPEQNGTVHGNREPPQTLAERLAQTTFGPTPPPNPPNVPYPPYAFLQKTRHKH